MIKESCKKKVEKNFSDVVRGLWQWVVENSRWTNSFKSKAERTLHNLYMCYFQRNFQRKTSQSTVLFLKCSVISCL